MKKIKKFLSIFLCSLTIFSFFGFNAYGATAVSTSVQYVVCSYNDGGNILRKDGVLGNITNTSIKASEISSGALCFSINEIDKDYYYNLNFVFSYTRYLNFKFSLYQVNSDDLILTQNVVSGHDGDDYSYKLYSGGGGSYRAFFSYNVEFLEPGTYIAQFSDFSFSSNIDAYTLGWGFSAFSITYGENKSTGFFNSILEWLKTIFDSIKDLPSSIGSFITDLGSQISGFFTDLINNIKTEFTDIKNNLTTWFNNIGSWFTELGDNIKTRFQNLYNNLKTWFNNIGTWFSDLWNNIAGIFNTAVDGITQWWSGLVEWFKSLWKIPDGYMEEYKNKFLKWFEVHFGFLYQSIELVGALVAVLLNLFSNTPDGTVIIPTITLPFGNYVILRQTSFNFNEMINSHSQLKWIFGLVKTATSAIVLVTFINYANNLMNEFIKDRKENDG